MKMGTIAAPWRYDVVLEFTLSTTNALPGGRSFYAGRQMTGVPGLQTGMALPVPSAVNLKLLSLLAASSVRNFKFKTALES